MNVIIGSQHASTSMISFIDAISHDSHKFPFRANCKHHVKIGVVLDHIMTLINYGLKINIMNVDFYRRGSWPIDTRHRWQVKANTSVTED